VLQLADPLFGSQFLLRKQTARGAAACRSTVWVSVLAQKADSTRCCSLQIHCLGLSSCSESRKHGAAACRSIACSCSNIPAANFARFCRVVVAQFCSITAAWSNIVIIFVFRTFLRRCCCTALQRCCCMLIAVSLPRSSNLICRCHLA